jgi:hypothetical protein
VGERSANCPYITRYLLLLPIMVIIWVNSDFRHGVNEILILYFKLSPCCINDELSSGYFPGVFVLQADVSEHCVVSSFFSDDTQCRLVVRYHRLGKVSFTTSDVSSLLGS